jgi:hypothetical protein
MKHVFYVYVFVTFVACACAQASTANASFSIAITPVHPNVTARDDVWIELTIKSLTDRSIVLGSSTDGNTNMDPNFVVEVTDEFGNPVPKVKYPVPPSGHPVSRTLDPGATMTEQEPVSRMFDMSKPGKYTIQASGPITDPPEASIVKSNKITVTVSPASPK